MLRFVALAALCLSCRNNPHDDVATGGVAGSAPSGGGSSTGGFGAGGSGDCPLDAIGKERLSTIYDAVLEDAEYVANGSHGIGVGADRAFGTRVPFSTLTLRHSTTVSEVCTGPKSYNPMCAEPEPGASGTFTRCVELSCESAGVLVAKAWIDPLPSELVADPPGGATVVQKLESRARYSEPGDGSLAITVDGLIELALADGRMIRRSIGADMMADAKGGHTLDVLSNIDGIALQSVALAASREGGSLSGDVIVNGAPIATIEENGIVFVGGCAE